MNFFQKTHVLEVLVRQESNHVSILNMSTALQKNVRVLCLKNKAKKSN